MTFGGRIGASLTTVLPFEYRLMTIGRSHGIQVPAARNTYPDSGGGNYCTAVQAHLSKSQPHPTRSGGHSTIGSRGAAEQSRLECMMSAKKSQRIAHVRAHAHTLIHTQHELSIVVIFGGHGQHSNPNPNPNLNCTSQIE